jgi:hypothetical protein
MKRERKEYRGREGIVGNMMSESLYLIDMLMYKHGQSLLNYSSISFGDKKECLLEGTGNNYLALLFAVRPHSSYRSTPIYLLV